MADTRQDVEAFNTAYPAPKTRRFMTREPRGKTTRTLEHGAFVFEAFDHLQKPDEQTTQDFINAQNDRTDAFLSRNPRFVEEKAALENKQIAYGNTVLEDKWQQSEPEKRGDREFMQEWNDATGGYRLMSRMEGQEEWTVFLDSASLAKDHSARVAAAFRPADSRYEAYVIKRPSRERAELHVMRFNEDGSFTDTLQCSTVSLPRYGEQLRLDEDGKGLIYTAYNPTLSCYEMRRCGFGEGGLKDKVLLATPARQGDYSTPRDYPIFNEEGKRSAFKCHGVLHNYGEYNELTISNGLLRRNLTLGNGEQSAYNPLAEVGGEIILSVNGDTAPYGKVISVNPKKPKEIRTLIEGSAENNMLSATFIEGRLVVKSRNKAGMAIAVHDAQGRHLQDVPVPEKSTLGIYRDSESTAGFDVSVQGYDHSGEFYHYDMDEQKLTKTQDAEERLENVVVETVEATSKDGTKVPMTVIRPKDVMLDGTAAVQLYGYGGFNAPRNAGWRADVGDWVQKGGVYVVANLRGGGEFGKEWYNQGRLHQKQNVFDDFAACAETLIEKGYTSPERLAITGASNGGLLTLATGLQRPELFGAVVSDVPVADMLYGSWQNDYGHPLQDKDDFENVMRYSPVHNIRAGQKYPPMLVATGAKDPTVPAWHSYRFVATMQAKSPDTLCLLQVNQEGGHADSTVHSMMQGIQEKHAFVENALGPISQQAYKLEQQSNAAEQGAEKTTPGKWQAAVSASREQAGTRGRA